MGLKLGNTDIADIKLGATQIASIYSGSELIWTGGTPEFEFNNALNVATSYDNVLFNSIFDSAGGDFTLSFWFYPTNVSSSIIFDSSGAGGNISIRANVIRVTSGVNYDFAFAGIPINTWHNIVLSRVGNLGTVFLNTVAVTKDFSSASGFDWYKFPAAGSAQVFGIYDEIGFKAGYGAVQADSDALYNNGDGADFSSVISSPDTVYHLDESTGLLAHDSSGNGNDGILGSFPTDDSQWVDHFTGLPSQLDTNVANNTYIYLGGYVEDYLEIFFTNADSTTLGRTIDIAGATITPRSQDIINELVNNRNFNVIT